jgi:phosphate transport system permease protein
LGSLSSLANEVPARHNPRVSQTINPVSTTPEPRVLVTKPRRSDQLFRVIVTSGGMSSLLVLGLILAFLAYRGFEVFRFEGFGLITSSDWSVVEDDNGSVVSQSYGLAAMLVGTVLSATIGVFIGIPIAVLSALFLEFYAGRKIRNFLIALIDLMAAFPSLLFGLWGFLVLMPSAEYWAKLLHKYLGWIPIFDVPAPVFTRSPFIAGVVLAIMIIPICTSISREVFSQTPLDRIQAAYALGATRLAMIRAVVIPFGRGGVIGGAMLGLGRAMGETVAVYSVLNIVYQVNWQVLFGAGGNIASMILLKIGEADREETNALMAAGLVLFLLTLIINFIANFLVNRLGKTGR